MADRILCDGQGRSFANTHPPPAEHHDHDQDATLSSEGCVPILRPRLAVPRDGFEPVSLYATVQGAHRRVSFDIEEAGISGRIGNYSGGRAEEWVAVGGRGTGISCCSIRGGMGVGGGLDVVGCCSGSRCRTQVRFSRLSSSFCFKIIDPDL